MGLLGRLGFEANYIVSRPLKDQEEGPFSIDGIDYRIANKKELLAASEHKELSLTTNFIEKAFENNDCCCAAFDKDRLVSYVWRTDVEAPHVPGVKVKVGEKQRYGYKAFTLPRYRGRGIYPRLSGLSDREFLRRGKIEVVAFTATHNFSSRAADIKLGNRIIGIGVILKLGRWIWIGHSPGVTAAGFRFVKELD